MQKLLERVDEVLRWFVGQREDLALVVRCRDEESVIVVKSLEAIDDSSASEMFWIFSDEFRDAPSYVSQLVAGFAVRHEAVRLAMPSKGLAPWPPMPPSVRDERLTPAERLRELMIFSRALLPAPDGFVAVWCLMPAVIANAPAYGSLVADVIHHDFPDPWCHHLRFVMRGDAATGALALSVGQRPRVRWYTPELDNEAMQRAAEEEANDPSLPLERRLQNLLMSAHMDSANQRFADALEKHTVLLKYYAGTQNATMSAIVLNAVGEVHQRMGNMEQANRCFEAAVEPACAAPAPPIPVLLNITLNLGNMRMAEQRWEEAEGYYDAAQRLATVQRAPDTKLRAMENLGHCQYMQGHTEPALATWQAGATVAGQLEMLDLRRRMLERLRAHYASVHDHEMRRDVEYRLMNPAELSPLTS